MPRAIPPSVEAYRVDIGKLKTLRINQRKLPDDLEPIDLDEIQGNRKERNRALASRGVTVERVLETHLQNLQAMHYIGVGSGNKREIIAVPDYATRQKAVEQAEKILEIVPRDTDAATQPIVNILVDVEKRAKIEGLTGRDLMTGEVLDVQAVPALDAGQEEEDATRTLGDRELGAEDEPGLESRGEEYPSSAEPPEQLWDAGSGESVRAFLSRNGSPSEIDFGF